MAGPNRLNGVNNSRRCHASQATREAELGYHNNQETTMCTEPEPLEPIEVTLADENKEKTGLRVMTWFSMGMAVAAVGIFVGREIFSRYKFKRRTPYDFYANADEGHFSEYGVGI
jgi:hypothetical protein